MDSSLKAWVRALESTAPIERRQAPILPVLIDSLAERFNSAPALISASRELSYETLAAAMNRQARWALAQGLGKGDVACLLMGNSPEYMATWLGLTRIGVTVALLNTNLTGGLLGRAIQAATPRAMIVGADFCEAFKAARDHVSPSLKTWTCGAHDSDLPPLEPELARMPSERITDAEHVPPALDERALYIYTSGTTGLPKAANVSHLRVMQWSHWFAGLMNTGPNDRMYNCLPMYHSIGGVVATGAVLVNGGAVVLRERFSASAFWKDIVDTRCTLFQYIGELCRYLVASPTVPEETRHSLRLCCGNGLRAEVWEQFQSRFGIPQILEYYAATEGSFSLYNLDGKPGAIGRIPAFLSHRTPIAIVKFDTDTNLPARDESGRCLRAQPNEIGEAIGQVASPKGAQGGRFEGYADRKASQEKVLHDVFEKGDAWYRTGDLMRRDEQGFFYFVDRVGDTFRWKGENVSTTEVAGVIASCPAVTDVAVYGVKVPGADGRAGMAALVVADGFDVDILRAHVKSRLPDYAQPLFVRIVGTIELTGTFRLRKGELAAQGFDPRNTGDRIYFSDRASGHYVLIDTDVYDRIRSNARAAGI